MASMEFDNKIVVCRFTKSVKTGDLRAWVIVFFSLPYNFIYYIVKLRLLRTLGRNIVVLNPRQSWKLQDFYDECSVS